MNVPALALAVQCFLIHLWAALRAWVLSLCSHRLPLHPPLAWTPVCPSPPPSSNCARIAARATVHSWLFLVAAQVEMKAVDSDTHCLTLLPPDLVSSNARPLPNLYPSLKTHLFLEAVSKELTSSQKLSLKSPISAPGPCLSIALPQPSVSTCSDLRHSFCQTM